MTVLATTGALLGKPVTALMLYSEIIDKPSRKVNQSIELVTCVPGQQWQWG